MKSFFQLTYPRPLFPFAGPVSWLEQGRGRTELKWLKRWRKYPQVSIRYEFALTYTSADGKNERISLQRIGQAMAFWKHSVMDLQQLCWCLTKNSISTPCTRVATKGYAVNVIFLQVNNQFRHHSLFLSFLSRRFDIRRENKCVRCVKNKFVRRYVTMWMFT